MKKVLSLALALMMLLTMCVVPVMAEDPVVETTPESTDPIFSQLLVQFIGRLPSNDPKNGVFVSLSDDNENWTEPVAYNGHGMDKWGCSNQVDPAYLGTIDVTEQAKGLTGDKIYVKLGMGAGDITWTVLHQVRVVGTFTGETAETEFFWEDYSNLAAFNRTGNNAAEAAADVVEKVPYAVSANHAFLYSCSVDHTATGLAPYHGGYYGDPENVNGHVVYEINLKGEPVDPPAEPTEKVFFEFLGRMPGDANGANKVQVMVGSDGENWKEAALLEGARDDHSDSTYFKVDITHAVDATANNLYVKMNLISYLAEWCSARQIRLTYVNAEGAETTLMHVIYDDMAIGSEEYKSGLYVDSANMQLRGTYDAAANDPSGLTMAEDCDGQDGKGLGNNYITYKIVLREEPVDPPVEPTEKVFFEFLGRMPGDANGANKVQVMVGSDGENWKEAALLEGARDDHSDSTYFKVDITHAVDATANNLYVKMNLISYLAEWCSARQIRLTYVNAEGAETTLMHVIYDDMAIGSEEYKSGLYVDSANMQLRGTYDAAANDPSGLTMAEDCDGQDGKGLGHNYITYKIVLREEPDVPAEPSFDGFIVNGDFETGDLTGWHEGYDSTITDAVAHGGKYSVYSTHTAKKYDLMLRQNDIAVKANTNYTLSFWYYYDGENADPSFYAYIKNGDVNVKSITTHVAAPKTWAKVTLDFNSGDYEDILVLFQNRTAEDGGIYYFDDIKIVEVKDPSFDGYITNGDFETGNLNSWVNLWDSCTVEFVEGYESDYAMSVVMPKQWQQVRQNLIPVEANTTYRLSAYVKNAQNVAFVIKEGNDSFDLTPSEIGAFPAGEDWQQFTMEFNTGVNKDGEAVTIDSICILVISYGEDGGSVIIDNITLTKVEEPVVEAGDANGDGKVNNRDLGLLQQYLNDFDVEPNLEACDVNGDGKVNNRDLGMLQQLLNA